MTFTIHAGSITCDRCGDSHHSSFPSVLRRWKYGHDCETPWSTS